MIINIFLYKLYLTFSLKIEINYTLISPVHK